MLLIIISQFRFGAFRFRNFFRKSLVYQRLLVCMHNQRLPVILHQFVNLSAVGNITLRLLIQQHIFCPVTDVMLRKQQAVIFRQPCGKHRLQVFMVKEVTIQFH